MRVPALVLLLVVALVSVTTPARAEIIDWLYQVRVPVADQSVSARRDAAALALQETLIRLSGMRSLPPSEQLDFALSDPSRYYSGFQYLRATPDAPLEVQFDFVPASTLALNKALELPVWWRNRPRVVPWLSVAGERLVLASDASPAPPASTSDDEASPSSTADPLAGLVAPLARAMATRARQRGLPLVLPTVDEAGLAPLSPQQLERASTFELQAASAGLNPELLGQGLVAQRGAGLVADVRFSALDPGADPVLNPDLELGNARSSLRNANEQPLAFSLVAPDPESLGVQLIDALADQLAARFAASGGGALAIRVRAVSTPAALVAMLRYLNSLSFLDSVSVVESSPDALTLVLDSQAGLVQLLDLLATDRMLVPQVDGDDPAALFGPPIFDWQG